jgi:hypothetical protein
MFRILVLLLSNHWFSQYYAQWFKRKHNGLKITANGLRPAKSAADALIIPVLSMFYALFTTRIGLFMLSSSWASERNIAV